MSSGMHLITSKLSSSTEFHELDSEKWEGVLLIGPEALTTKLHWHPRIIGRCAQVDFYNDWSSLQALHEDARRLSEYLLNLLSGELRALLDRPNWSRRSWEIALAPWLRTFVTCVLHSQKFLELTTSKYSVSSITKFTENLEPPQNTRSWLNNLQNGNIHMEIAAEVGLAMGLKPHMSSLEEDLPRYLRDASEPDTLPRISYKHVSSLFGVKKLLVNATYLGFVREKFLELSLGQLPALGFRRRNLEPAVVNWGLRNNLAIQVAKFPSPDIGPKRLNLEWWAGEIAKYLPLSLLESSGAYLEEARKAWGSETKVIFDSNSYWADDPFKLHAAEAVARDSKFVIGQHGGLFGSARWHNQQDHIVSVSDVFLTWGWSLNSTHKVVPTGRLKKVPKVPYRESGRLLLTLADFPAYMYDDTAMLIGKRNSLDYLEDQALFFRTLSLNSKID